MRFIPIATVFIHFITVGLRSRERMLRETEHT